MLGSGRRATARLAMGGLVAAIMLSACAENPGDATGPDGSSEPSTTASDQPVVVEFVIDSGQVSPTINRVPVDIGDEVRLIVTTDEADSIHVHGVERTLVLETGVEGVLDFVIPVGLPRGVYPVEGHNSGLILFELRVR